MSEAPPPLPKVRDPDDEHLRLLAIFHYVVAGLSLLGLAFLAMHYALMRTFFANPEAWKTPNGGPPFPPPQVFAVFQWFYLLFGVLVVLSGVANLLSGRFIRARRHRLFSLVVAGFDCAQFPFGTTLGVFTFIVLLRDSVRARYEAADRASL